MKSKSELGWKFKPDFTELDNDNELVIRSLNSDIDNLDIISIKSDKETI